MQSGAPVAFAFETERLLMRPLHAGDEALFCGLYTDAETMRYIGEPLTPERALRNFRKAVASWNDDPLKRAFLTVLDKANRHPLGICAIVQIDVCRVRAEVGMMLIGAACAHGVATEGLAALVTKAFAIFPIDEVWVQYAPRHVAAKRLVCRLGFAQQAETPKCVAPTQQVWSVCRVSWSCE